MFTGVILRSALSRVYPGCSAIRPCRPSSSLTPPAIVGSPDGLGDPYRGLLFIVAFLLTVAVLVAIGLLKPKRSRPDDGSTGYPLYPLLDGGGDAGRGSD
ncbi:hypothetical protein ACTMS0_18315 [Micromonospora sp. H33]|uniref:hypothetical protein n=1 Tax=Micromonospora sp. H33 TaxID=3452215 RepID=UPI003F8B89BA